MILVETTHWPLVVVGTIQDPVGISAQAALDESRLWSSRHLRLAVVISGDDTQAASAQDEVFAWLREHRDRLWRCVWRVAWIVEDEHTRRSAEQWLTLAGDRLFRGEVTTFRSVRTAVSWLVSSHAPQAERVLDR